MMDVFLHMHHDHTYDNANANATMGATTTGAMTAGAMTTADVEGVVEHMDSICALCPNFLLPTVLEGVLGEQARALDSSQIEQVLACAREYPARNATGFALGLHVLAGCLEHGADDFFKTVAAFDPDEIMAFRTDAHVAAEAASGTAAASTCSSTSSESD